MKRIHQILLVLASLGVTVTEANSVHENYYIGHSGWKQRLGHE